MKWACIFPGQGSQSIGMLADLAENNSLVNDLFSSASEILSEDLWSIVINGPEERLNSTEITQPAMLTAAYAVWRVWLEQGGPRPDFMAGHSLGEYTALVCADALSFEDAVMLVHERGKLMQNAVPAGKGAMAAILGLQDEQVRTACEQAANGQVVEAVNYNSPGQVVIAGERDAVERAIDEAKAAGAKRAMLLAVSVPSHCSLMHEAADQLAEKLAAVDFSIPTIPVIQNVDALAHNDTDSIRAALASQLHKPVRWVESIQYLHQQGVTRMVECGPGKVLTGLNKRIEKTMKVSPANGSQTLQAALQAIAE
ncbi:MAG TPA: [acyl-carrier-protein] S-malonyltransferase [Gammaproteobacteria bacterium]|nr:[acyl-carrier-protein] S-malonyltransferase [Gammaproteobacteria bacterium]